VRSVSDLLADVEAAVRAGDFAAAARALADARVRARDDRQALRRVVYLETTLHAYRHDYEAAANVLLTDLETTSRRLDDPTAFQEHNWLAMLRTAQADLTAALVEHRARTLFGERASWATPPSSERGSDRQTQVRLKDSWHRAYVLRMLAEQLSGTRRQATLRYAEEARSEYATMAAPLGTYGDSIAVLDAFFAMHDGDPSRARAAAKRVDVANNDDVEDLYLTWAALDFAGDRESAAAVRAKIEGVSYVSFAVPMVRSWIERDTDMAPKKRWTPRNVTGAP
jgi:hypothetical protein